MSIEAESRKRDFDDSGSRGDSQQGIRIFALFMATTLILLPLFFGFLHFRVKLAARDSVDPGSRYSVYLVEIQNQRFSRIPPFGFGAPLHIREALSTLPPAFRGCERVNESAFHRQRFSLSVDFESLSFRVKTSPQGGQLQLQKELICLRKEIERQKLPQLARLQVPSGKQPDILIDIYRHPVK